MLRDSATRLRMIPRLENEHHRNRDFDRLRQRRDGISTFAMTGNKSRGQTLRVVGVDLRKQCFSHGQLYVACSRISSSNFIDPIRVTIFNVKELGTLAFESRWMCQERI